MGDLPSARPKRVEAGSGTRVRGKNADLRTPPDVGVVWGLGLGAYFGSGSYSRTH